VAEPKDATKDADPKCTLPSAVMEGEEDSDALAGSSDEDDVNTKNDRQSTDAVVSSRDFPA
jgi:hypothetical protein